MRAISFQILLVIVTANILSALYCRAAGGDGAILKDQALPEAPMQHADWTPPKADLKPDLAVAVKRLFEQGLADPRGCEYRAITVEVGSCWGGGGPVQCHGWVLPAADPKAPRFAVCWNGLVYSVMSMKDKADADADMRTIIKSDEDTKAAARENNGFPFNRFGSACPAEGTAVSEKSMLPIKACMLLRLGDGELASHLWKAWGGPDNGNAKQPDPYLELSGAFEWVNFDRAICAHMRGDDRLSLASAKAVSDLRKSVEQELDHRHIDPPQGDGRSYLDVVPGLIEDEERRLKEPPRARALKLGEPSFANKAAWVAALVADLDQVSATQMGQPGGVDLGRDPIVTALIACGDDAVEPLLNCFEHDTRLTRSVHFWRDFAPNRMPIGTPEAAYVALSGILQTSFFAVGSTGDDLTSHGQEGRAKLAAAMRDYWKKYKGVSMVDRWYATLEDDGGNEHKWAEALGNIMRPVDVTVTPGSMFGTGWVSTPQRKPGEKPKFTGESLRAKKNPSLVDLVAKRIEAIDHLDDNSSGHVYQVAAASDMAIELMQWDPEAAKPVARKQLDFCIGMFSNNFFSQYGEAARSKVAGLASALARAGDPSGLKIYGNWMRTITPHELGAQPDAILSPLWKFQDDPAIAATAEWLFNDPKSAWNPMLPKVEVGWNQQELLRSPLLGLKSFRDQMMRGLADESSYGTITIHNDRTAEMKTERMTQRVEIASGEILIAPVGTEMKIRNCDEYARELSLCAGAPHIQFYWPEAQRDAAVKACREFLTAYGEHFRYTDQYTFNGDFPETNATARLTFHPLDHPATQEDVKSHRTIFSLEGEGERRLYKLPSIPTKAAWITLKKYPLDQQWFGMDGKSGINHVFSQDCWAWQAEEVKTAKGWERYIGVVGPHEIAKVPASEIEFTEPFGWASLPNGLDLKIELPGFVNPDGKFTPLSTTSPLIARIVIRNRRAVAQSLPTQFLTKTADGKWAIRPGMKISITPTPERDDAAAPTPLAMKPLPSLNASQLDQQKLLESTETFAAGEFDLKDLFDINKPGKYQLEIQFTKESAFGEARGWTVYFELANAAK